MCEETIITEQMKHEFKSLDDKMNNLEESINLEIEKQLNVFHELRKKKKAQKDAIMKNIAPTYDSNRLSKDIKRSSKYNELIESLCNILSINYSIFS